MENKKIKNKVKKIHLVDGLLVVATLIGVLFLFNFTQPMVIAPLGDFETSESSILFSIEKAEKILIDSSLDFNNPKEYYIQDGTEIELEPGEYYWKAINSLGVESEIRKLTIISRIDLRLKENLENYEVVNAGNTKLKVDVYDQEQKIESFSLNPEESKFSLGTKFFGGLLNE